MKRRKFSKCFVAMLLVIVMGITAVPMSVLTVVADGVKSVTEELKVENTYTPPNEIESTDLIDSSELENAYILDEKIEGRTFNSKEFIMSDGTILVQQFVQNIHYEDEEGLKEIDNTIIESEDENGQTFYENSANFYKVKMSKEFKPNKEFLELKNGEYHLSFTFVDDSAKNATANKNDKVKEKSNNKYNDKKLKNPKPYSSGEGKIYYAEIAKDVDLEYETQDNGIKENIIVNDYLADYDFDFKIKVKNLTLQENLDGSISAINEEGEEKYVIPAPFMFDANGEYNYEVEYVLTEVKDGYTLTISADEEWIETKASLPVTIDPIIETMYDNGYEFRNVYQSGTVSTSGSEVYVGEKDSGNRSDAYFRFKLGRSETHTIVGASLTYHHKTAGMKLLRKETINYSVSVVDSEAVFSNITYTNKPEQLQFLYWFNAENVRISSEGTYNHKINPETLRGDFLTVAFQRETNNTSDGYAIIYATGSNGIYLTVRYKQITGLDEDYSVESAGIDGATAYVNKATGKLVVDCDFASVSNYGLALKSSLIYNTGYNEVFSELGVPNMFGNNFKLNFQQYVRVVSSDYLSLYDADGSVTMFCYEPDHGVYRSVDKLLTATVSGSTVTIYDAALNARRFSNGRLVEIYNYLSVIYDQSSDELIEIEYYTSSGTTMNKISSISYRDAEINAEYKINFTYQGDRVSNVSTSCKGSTLMQYSLQYDSSGNLISVRNNTANTDIYTMEYDSSTGYLDAIFNRFREGICFAYEPYGNRIYTMNYVAGETVGDIKWYDYVEFDYDSAYSVTEACYISNGKEIARTFTCFDVALRPISEWTTDGTGEISGEYKEHYDFNYNEENYYFDYTQNTLSFVSRAGGSSASFNLYPGESGSTTISKPEDVVDMSSCYRYGLTFMVESQYGFDLTASFANGTKRIALTNGGKLFVVVPCSYVSTAGATFKNNNSGSVVKISRIRYDCIGSVTEKLEYQTDPSVQDVYAITNVLSYSRSGERCESVYNGCQQLIQQTTYHSKDLAAEKTVYEYSYYGPSDEVYLSSSTTTKSNEIIKRNSTSIDSQNVFTTKAEAGSLKKMSKKSINLSYNGYSIKEIGADGIENLYTYGISSGDVRLVSFKRGDIIEEYTYDYFGNVTRIRVKNSGGAILSVSENSFSGGVLDGHTFGGKTYAYTYDSYGNVSGIKQGTDIMLSYEYAGDNYNGYLDDLTKKTYANGQLEEYDYSYGVYSVTHKKQNGGALEITDVYDYTYDARNRVTSSSYEKNGAVQLTYNYGDLNNKTQSVLTTTGLSYNAEFTINTHSLYNRVNSTVDKFTNNGVDTTYTNTYGYNNKNYLTSNTIGDYNSSIGYDAFDRLNTYVAKNNNTIVVDRTYYYAGYTVNGVVYSTDRLDYIYDSKDPNNTIENSYNSNGLISQIKYNGKTYNYTYDDLGRLKTETVDGTTITYKYDLNAYLEADQFIETLAFNSLSEVVGGEYGATYTYDNKGRLSSLVQQGETLYFTYDAMGNPTTYKGSSSSAPANMTWTQGRKLENYTVNGSTYSYSYDMNGMRYKKTVNGNVTEYYLDGSTIIAENRKVGSSNTFIYYIYDSMGLSGMVYGGNTYYYLKNTLGDIIGIKDSLNNTVATYTYDAWGNILSMSGSMADVNPFRYRGYYYDTESGFYYLQTRYYDPTIRQFINADNYELLPTLSQTIGQLNLYAYANNNPIMFTDETGEAIVTLMVSALIGAIVSAGVNVVSQLLFNNGQINWGQVGVSALFGAVGGLLGCTGIGGSTGQFFIQGILGVGEEIATNAVAGTLASVTILDVLGAFLLDGFIGASMAGSFDEFKRVCQIEESLTKYIVRNKDTGRLAKNLISKSRKYLREFLRPTIVDGGIELGFGVFAVGGAWALGRMR